MSTNLAGVSRVQSGTYPGITLVQTAGPAATATRPLDDVELVNFADAFAGQFGYEAWKACDRPVLWYQQEIGANICPHDDAAVIRLMTMARCREITNRRMRRPEHVADLVGAPEIMTYPLMSDAAAPSLFVSFSGRVTTGTDNHYEADRPSAWNLARWLLLGVGVSIGVYALVVGVAAL